MTHKRCAQFRSIAHTLSQFIKRQWLCAPSAFFWYLAIIILLMNREEKSNKVKKKQQQVSSTAQKRLIWKAKRTKKGNKTSCNETTATIDRKNLFHFKGIRNVPLPAKSRDSVFEANCSDKKQSQTPYSIFLLKQSICFCIACAPYSLNQMGIFAIYSSSGRFRVLNVFIPGIWIIFMHERKIKNKKQYETDYCAQYQFGIG